MLANEPAARGDLFSALPARRWDAACAANPDGRVELPAEWEKAAREWPMFSAGALNAWLLFVGVSPGDSTPDGVDLKKEHWLPTRGVRQPYAAVCARRTTRRSEINLRPRLLQAVAVLRLPRNFLNL